MQSETCTILVIKEDTRQRIRLDIAYGIFAGVRESEWKPGDVEWKKEIQKPREKKDN
jgi:hypothetical protein